MTNINSHPPDLNTRPIPWAGNLLSGLIALWFLYVVAVLVLGGLFIVLMWQPLLTLGLLVFGLARFYK